MKRLLESIVMSYMNVVSVSQMTTESAITDEEDYCLPQGKYSAWSL